MTLSGRCSHGFRIAPDRHLICPVCLNLAPDTDDPDPLEHAYCGPECDLCMGSGKVIVKGSAEG